MAVGCGWSVDRLFESQRFDDFRRTQVEEFSHNLGDLLVRDRSSTERVYQD